MIEYSGHCMKCCCIWEDCQFHYPEGNPPCCRTNNISLGKFTIYEKGRMDGKIWIEHESGEGGDFDREVFAEIVGKFYSDNF